MGGKVDAACFPKEAEFSQQHSADLTLGKGGSICFQVGSSAQIPEDFKHP